MRVPWPEDHPQVLVHRCRDDLFGHWGYNLAKQHRDVHRAIKICEDLHSYDVLAKLYDDTADLSARPIVVAPARPIGDTNNALGRTFARFVAQELACDLCNGIVQTNAVKRDFIKDPYFRMAQSPTFAGDVIEGRSYILVDDVFTMGGTLAALRGFIIRNGGSVVGMTTLAEKEGGHVAISLAKDTGSALEGTHDGALASLVPQWTGFGLDCLTEPEGRFLLKQSSADSVGAGFRRARDGGA